MIYDNGVYRELTAEEVAAMEAAQAQAEAQYWANTAYDDAVHDRIRRKYTESQEFALLRQREEKPEEFAAYFAYCEACKAWVREKKGMDGEVTQ